MLVVLRTWNWVSGWKKERLDSLLQKLFTEKALDVAVTTAASIALLGVLSDKISKDYPRVKIVIGTGTLPLGL